MVDELSGRCKRLVAALVGAREGSRAAGGLLVLHLCRLAAAGTVSRDQAVWMLKKQVKIKVKSEE